FSEFTWVEQGGGAIDLDAAGSRFQCTLAEYQCTRTGAATTGGFGRGGAGAAAIRPGGVNGDAPTASTACLPPTTNEANGRGRGAGRGGAAGGGGRGAGNGAPATTGCVSPDGQSVAFVQNFNVAVRPASGGGRSQPGVGGSGGEAAYTLVTYDGSEGDAYQQMSIRWSPDSKH